MILKGLRYLESAPGERQDADADNERGRTGLKALVGLTFVKALPQGADLAEHPQVRDAVVAIRAEINSNFTAVPRANPAYTAAFSLLFLTELDPIEYRPEINALVEYLVGLQKPHGGWGYLTSSLGDMSMTQLAAVSLWVCSTEGIEVDIGVWERLCNFAVRVQDPSGQWGYQAKDPGNFELTSQEEMRHSMTVAGLCTLGLAAERCGVFDFDDRRPSDSPLGPVEKRRERRERFLSPNVNAEGARHAFESGARWLRENHTLAPPQWPYYYLFAFERFQSIREHLTDAVDFPNWYDDGVAHLEEAQEEDGCWRGLAPTSLHPTADTCFAILFLSRSFRDVLDRPVLGGGVLKSVRMDDLDDESFEAAIQKLIVLLKQERSATADAINAIKHYANEQADAESQSRWRKRLVRLFAGSESPLVRASILRTLAFKDDLENAPLFIEAMNDADLGVVMAADAGLARLSRKIAGVAPLGSGTQEEVDAAIAGWKQWLRSIKPEADDEEQE